MLRRALPIMLLLSIPTLGFGQARAAAPSVVGVWKLAETVTTGANAVTNTNLQPSLYILTNKHYSVLSVNSTEPRPKFGPLKTPGKPTDAEKIARFEQWDLFTANAGTYEIKGTTLAKSAARRQASRGASAAFGCYAAPRWRYRSSSRCRCSTAVNTGVSTNRMTSMMRQWRIAVQPVPMVGRDGMTSHGELRGMGARDFSARARGQAVTSSRPSPVIKNQS